jgi:hypothetical protein
MYKPVVLALMAKTTNERYEGIIKDYLSPAFGSLCLGDLSVLTAQRYFSNTENFAGLVARDGVEPPTPAFSGLRTTALSAFFFNNLTLQSGPGLVTIL